MARFSSFALATVLSLGSTATAAHAGVTDIEHLGSGGMCNTGEISSGVIKDGSNMVITPGRNGKDCEGLYALIKELRNKEINSEERINTKLINSQHTVGMINSIGSIAGPLLGSLLANSQSRTQAAPPAPDNSQYLQVIQQQQQQIDELRQMMAQRQAPATSNGYMTVQSQTWRDDTPPVRRYDNQRTFSLRQTNLF